MLRGAEGPWPWAGGVLQFQDRFVLTHVARPPGRLPSEAVDAVALGRTIQRQDYVTPLEREATRADPVRIRHEREGGGGLEHVVVESWRRPRAQHIPRRCAAVDPVAHDGAAGCGRQHETSAAGA